MAPIELPYKNCKRNDSLYSNTERILRFLWKVFKTCVLHVSPLSVMKLFEPSSLLWLIRYLWKMERIFLPPFVFISTFSHGLLVIKIPTHISGLSSFIGWSIFLSPLSSTVPKFVSFCGPHFLYCYCPFFIDVKRGSRKRRTNKTKMFLQKVFEKEDRIRIVPLRGCFCGFFELVFPQ